MLSHPSRHTVELTEDGSPTVRDLELGCTFHSRYGALAESRHVFVDAGLRFWTDASRTDEACCTAWTREGSGEVRILEVGFGTGMNVAATMVEFPVSEIHFTSIDKYPIDETVADAVVAASPVEIRDEMRKVLDCEWDSVQSVSPRLTLTKREADLLSITGPILFDVCYFDAFAPKAQPELWSTEVFQRLLDWGGNGAVLVTYCSKGDVRRALQAVGWSVTRVAGAKGKREMLRAVKRSC